MLLFSQFFFDKSGIYIKTVLQSRPSLYIIMVRRRKAARKPRVAVITPDNDMITAHTSCGRGFHRRSIIIYNDSG